MDPRTGLPVVGVIGDGAATRMLQQAALGLGQSLRIFAGRSDGLDELRAFARDCDVVTFADAPAPIDQLAALEADGATVHPGAETLRQRAAVPGERVGGRTLAVVLARSPFGQGAVWPVVESLDNGVEVIAPAPGLDDDRAAHAQELALRIARNVDVTGVFAVELAETPDGLGVRDVAIGPHRAANWTIEGARTSQFEQHLRAVLDYPLGTTAQTAPIVVTATVFAKPGLPDGIDERLHHAMARWPDVKIHLYGESVCGDGPVGHVTALGDHLGEVRASARAAADYLTKGTA